MNIYTEVRIVARIKKLEKSIELARLCGEKDYVISRYEAKLAALKVTYKMLAELDTEHELEV